MALPCQIKGRALISLVDNGASGIAFISSFFALSFNLPLFPLPHPQTLVAYDGKASASVITHYIIIILCIGRHFENLSAFMPPIAKWLLIHGLPWLAKHNAFVDWKQQEITFELECINKKHRELETTVLWGDMQPFEAPAQLHSPDPKPLD
jgi:hypothetical protein